MLNWLKVVGGVMGRSEVEHAGSQGRSAAIDGLEGLEQRMLLTGEVSYATEMIQWRGSPLEVIQDSWVLTFNGKQSRTQADARARQVAGFLGLPVSRVETTARGVFAKIVTPNGVTEGMAAAAKNRFGFLRGLEPEGVRELQLTPNDGNFGQQWPILNTGQAAGNSGVGIAGADMDATLAWNLSTGSRQVVVAVLDTGTDLEHPDLRPNLWTNPLEIPNNGVDDDGNGFVDDVYGWDFASAQAGGDNNPDDPMAQGHGTAVAGTIGAVGNNGIGVAGVNWNVSIMTLKIFPEEGNAALFPILAAFDYMAMMKSQFGVNIVVSNNSWGSLSQNPEQFNDAESVGVRMTTDAGILFVAAAGNDTNNNDGPIFAFPASYDNPRIISVAATNNKDQLAGFSNFGLTSVDVGAPGEQVFTTANGGGYEYIDGTSFSSPYTAGVIALMSSVNRFATPESLRDGLFASVDAIPALQGRTVTGGRINAYRALLAIGVPGPLVSAISPGPVTAPVSQIIVAFNKSIDPMFFDPAGIELRAANMDARFDGNDIFHSFTSSDVTLEDNILTITIPGGSALPRDAYRLTLAATNFRDLDGNYLNGDTGSGSDEQYVFTVVAFRGPLEPNDTIGQASPLILDASGHAEIFGLFIGDGLNEPVDVDIFRVFVSGPSLISATVIAKAMALPSTLDSYLRLFDASGTELTANDNFFGLDSKIEYFVAAGGAYYLGVSAFGNSAYLPGVEASGTPGFTTGNYDLIVQVSTSANENTSLSNTTPVAIPSTGTITSTIYVPDGRSVADVNVRLEITHSYVSDLVITLTSPGGSVVTLVNRRGGAGQNFTNTIFDQQAVTPIAFGAAPFTGTFQPEATLAAVNGAPALGTWTLTIQDVKALDAGMLNSWRLDFVLNNDVFGPFEVNDTLITAAQLGISGTGSQTLSAFVGDGAFGLRDVDLFRFTAGAGTTITAMSTPTGGGTLDTIIRIFDAQGVQLSIDKSKGSVASTAKYIVSSGGTFYVGVSGGNTTSPTDFGNAGYDPSSPGSGTVTDATGTYTLTISVSGGISEGGLPLVGNLIGVGINADGAIGLPTGSPARGLTLGQTEFLLGDPTPEAFFGATFDGFSVRNAGTGEQTDLAMAVANESDYANRRVLTSGLYRDTLSIRRTLSFGVNDAFIAVDVILTNRGQSAINDVAWVEGLDPSQRYVQTAGGRTANDIDATGRLATASGGGFTIGLGAPAGSVGVFTSFETPGSIRDAYQVINSTFDPEGATADLMMAIAFNIGTMDVGQTSSFRYFIFLGTTPATVNAAFAILEAGAGTGHLVADPLDPTISETELPYAIYYPAGFANARSNTFVPIVNPNDQSARVVVIAHYAGSAPSDVLFDSATDAMTTGFVFPAHQRRGVVISNPTLYANGTVDHVKSQYPGRLGVLKQEEYSLEIRSSIPVGATLSHYDYNISTGEAFTSQLNTVWTFGDGTKGNKVVDVAILYNPNPIPVKVTLTAYPTDGSAAVIKTLTVGPQRRAGWNLAKLSDLNAFPVDPETNQRYFAFSLEGEAPIVAAMTHFDTNQSAGFGTLGLAGGGSTSGSTPEGQVGVNADAEFVSILNAGSQTANMTVTFSFLDGGAYRRLLTVAPASRATVNVADLPGFPAGQAYAVSYTSNVPVTVTLPSYAYDEAIGTTLASQAATQWLFSVGFYPVNATNGVKEFLRIYNPQSEAVTVAITINFNNGETETFLRDVNGHAANVFDIHDFVTGLRRTEGTNPVGPNGGRSSSYGLKVQSATPIVALQEHIDPGLGGGYATLGLALGTIGSAV